MSISYERCEYRDEKVTTSFSDQLVEQEMSTDGREDQHAFDSSSDDSPSRKRHLEPYDDNALNVKDDVLENEAIGTKRQKVDVANSRKPNTDQWDSMFLRLAAYKAEKGDCLVPKRYAPDPKLGTWVETQRVQYKRLQREFDLSRGVEQVQPNKRLDQTRLTKLNSLGFAWSAKTQRKSSPVLDPNTSQENPVVPPKNKSKKLGFDEKGLPARHAARALVLDAQWNEMYERLVKYKDEHGDTLVPRKYENDPRLAAWVETQRILWNRDFREAGEGNPEVRTEAQIDAVEKNDASSLNQITDLADERAMSFVEASGITGECTTNMEGEREDACVENITQRSIYASNEEDCESMNLPTELKRLSCERKDKLDKLGFVWSLRTKRIEDHWDDMFRQLVEYKNKHGDCLVPSRYEENLKLGKWVETQRYEYTKLLRVSSDSTGSSEPLKRAINPRLTDERRRRLESIGFEWKVRNKMKRYYDKQWDQMFDRLLEFKAKHGHCLVPKRYPEDMKLGTWVHTQRIQYRKLLEGSKSQASDRNSDTASQLSDKSEDEVSFRLTDERRKRLSDIGFVWSVREAERTYETTRIVRTSYDDQWDAMFNLLNAYKEKYGDCLVPKRYAENPKLGTWVDTQRVQYKKMKKKNEGDRESGLQTVSKPAGGRLTDERIRRLEDLGFVWSLRDDWQKHYDELKEFKKEYNHCNVPARYAKNRRLGIWVSAQRQQFKLLQKLSSSEKQNVRLNEERIRLLNDLGFTWTIRSRDTLGETWNQKVRELKDFRDIHGHCNVPMFYDNNPELRSWVEAQRKLYHEYLMYTSKRSEEDNGSEPPYSDEKIRVLDELGFDWTGRINQRFSRVTEETPTGIDALQKASTLASARLGDGTE